MQSSKDITRDGDVDALLSPMAKYLHEKSL
jgi:hypothetical protein